jgi:hypothetical protein
VRPDERSFAEIDKSARGLCELMAVEKYGSHHRAGGRIDACQDDELLSKHRSSGGSHESGHYFG